MTRGEHGRRGRTLRGSPRVFLDAMAESIANSGGWPSNGHLAECCGQQRLGQKWQGLSPKPQSAVWFVDGMVGGLRGRAGALTEGADA